MTDSLVRFFKQSPQLDTDIGSFTYVSNIGSGGNANVLKFKRNEHEFAIKFLPHNEEGKLRRFRDEFFCAAQIPTHKNVVISYHFDTKKIDEIYYSIIVMKAYSSTLNSLGHISEKTKSDQKARAWKLFEDLCTGLNHLHRHHIIHRDIKPQNIFYDEETDSFVIGDLGIAHFKADVFAKEAQTKPTERLANYLFSAPEQVNSKIEITEAADIYSLGQVLQWYLTGATVRGQGRSTFKGESSRDELSILDGFTSRALRDKPSERFQNIQEVVDFIENAKKPPLDPWKKIEDFDDVICSSFPEIRKTLSITNLDAIDAFLKKFQEKCNPADFWYRLADGGDNNLKCIDRIGDKSWLLNGFTEITVNRLLIYRNSNYIYKNFFILLFGPDKRFVYTSSLGKKVRRPSSPDEEQDMATLVDNSFYVAPSETVNGYYRMNNDILVVTRERFTDRQRYLVPYGLIIVPTQTASASMHDHRPTSNLILAAIRDRELTENELKIYLDATRDHHSSEITMWN